MLKTPNLRAWYRMEKISGGKLLDSSGNGFHLTNSGSTIVAGKVGNALDFDGVDDRATGDTKAYLMGTGSILTVAAWVKLDAYVNIAPAVSGGQWGYQLAILLGANLQCRIRTSTSGFTVVNILATGNIPLNTWIHVAMTYDKVALKLYINGVYKAQTLSTANVLYAYQVGPIYDDFQIGAYPLNPYYFNGQIDEVLIYSKALSETDIKRIYCGLNPLNG